MPKINAADTENFVTITQGYTVDAEEWGAINMTAGLKVDEAQFKELMSFVALSANPDLTKYQAMCADILNKLPE